METNAQILFNGKFVVSGDTLTMKMIFNNISGKNFSTKEDRKRYLQTTNLDYMLTEKGTVELQIDGKTERTYTFR